MAATHRDRELARTERELERLVIAARRDGNQRRAREIERQAAVLVAAARER